LEECLIATAELQAIAGDRLAKLRFTLNSMITHIERSADAIETSEALLAKLHPCPQKN
jgi:hypothetical protein